MILNHNQDLIYKFGESIFCFTGVAWNSTTSTRRERERDLPLSNAHTGIVTSSSCLIKHCCAAFLELAEGRHSNINSFHFNQHKRIFKCTPAIARFNCISPTVHLQLFKKCHAIPHLTTKSKQRNTKRSSPRIHTVSLINLLPPSTCIDRDRIVPTTHKMNRFQFILLVLMGLFTSSMAAVPRQVVDSGVIIDSAIDKNYDVDSTPGKELLDHQILPHDNTGLVRRYELKCTKDRSVAPPKGFMPGRLLSDKFCQGWWDCKSDGKGLHCPVALPSQGTSWH